MRVARGLKNAIRRIAGLGSMGVHIATACEATYAIRLGVAK